MFSLEEACQLARTPRMEEKLADPITPAALNGAEEALLNRVLQCYVLRKRSYITLLSLVNNNPSADMTIG